LNNEETATSEGQHNCLESADQRECGGNLAARSWKAAAAPWIILAAWLTVAGVAVLYMVTRSWGFLGNLLPLIMILASLMAFATWLTAWSWLGANSARSRLAFFLAGTLGMSAITGPLFRWDKREPLAAATQFLVGLAIPNMLLRRRGWRIAISPAATRSSRGRELWQFSIADILIVVTGFAAILGLQAAHRATVFESLLLGGVAIVGAPMAACFILSWRRIWLAALMSTAFAMLFTVLINFVTWHFTWESLVEVFLYISAVFLAGLWASLGSMRVVGYRMVGAGETDGDSSAIRAQ